MVSPHIAENPPEKTEVFQNVSVESLASEVPIETRHRERRNAIVERAESPICVV